MRLHRHLPLLAALLAIVLCAPSLGVGLIGDDYYHRALLLGIGDLQGTDPVWEMFRFLVAGAHNERLQAQGILPWWGSTDITAAFCRPLSALTHVLDYALWPNNMVMQHAHNLLWLGLGTALVAHLMRRSLPPAAAVLATLLFAVEDAHALPAGWIANRNALVTLVLGLTTVLLHLRWLERPHQPRWLLGALLALGLGLASGEAALGALAYVFAAQILSPKPRRLWALLPYGLLVVAWRILYDQGGYGASGSGLYVDPGHQPLAFALALLERWPLLAAAQVGQLPVDLWILLPRSLQLVASAVCGGAVVAGGGWLLVPLLRDRPEARPWALGSALSLVPLCAAFPMERLLLFAGVGAAALLALLWHHRARWDRRRQGLIMALVVVHGPLAALALVFRCAVLLPVFGHLFAIGATQAPTDAALSQQALIFVNGTELPVSYTGIIRMVTQEAPVPLRVSMLSSQLVDNHFSREDAHTLVVTPEGGFFHNTSERMFVGSDRRFAVGEVITGGVDFAAEVRAVTADGRPAQIAFRFEAPLESDAYRWVVWTPSGVQPYTPLSVGEEEVLGRALPLP